MARAQLLLLAIFALFASSAVAQGVAGRINVNIPTEIEVEVDESSSLRTGLVLRLGNPGGCSVLGLRGCVGDLLTLRLKAIVREGNVLVSIWAGAGGGRRLEVRIPIDLESLAADLTLNLDLSSINLRIGNNVVRLVGPEDATIDIGLGVGVGVNLSPEGQAAIAAILQGLVDLSVALGVNATIALDITLVLLHLFIDIFLGLGLDVNLNIANLVRVALNA